MKRAANQRPHSWFKPAHLFTPPSPPLSPLCVYLPAGTKYIHRTQKVHGATFIRSLSSFYSSSRLSLSVFLLAFFTNQPEPFLTRRCLFFVWTPPAGNIKEVLLLSLVSFFLSFNFQPLPPRARTEPPKIKSDLVARRHSVGKIIAADKSFPPHAGPS